MRVGIATVSSPFIRGGAEIHAEGLAHAVRERGHDVEVISMPFRFDPPEQIRRSMDIWETEELGQVNGYSIDALVCLKFPAFYAQHPNKIAWILHQHRAAYDLWGTPFGEGRARTAEDRALRTEIVERDSRALAACSQIFSNSKTVASRLLQFNNIRSQPLYHPPPLADIVYSAPAEPYIFFPSRLEDLKRQCLLVEAMRYVTTPVVALVAGEGGRRDDLQRMIDDLDLGRRVRLLGRVGLDELLAYYAHCLGVFFGPYDEDYGYVTLEAMLAAKPVITCTDSGGPVEFVVDQETGYIVEPEPRLVAHAVDELYRNQRRARDLGRAGLALYRRLDISWQHVVDALLRPVHAVSRGAPALVATSRAG
ncbi:MAG: glycosyltransferase family 4 protein [Chloroflexi bacterium]|nr:glycosyltransferase family 4 protein [Chloroflexota bacterium]